MDVIESGSVIDVRLLHLRKEKLPMVATVSGITTVNRPMHGKHVTAPRGLLAVLLVRTSPYPRQLGKALSSMVITEFGRVSLLRLVSANAL